jgi:hypothetical protein
MSNQVETNVIAKSLVITANGDTSTYPLDLSRFATVMFLVKCEAVSGTNPTLDVIFKQTEPKTPDTVNLQVVPQFTGTGSNSYVLTHKYNKGYISWIIGGTATPTFTMTFVITGIIL